MKRLIIKTFENELIGTVIQHDNGNLEVQGEKSEYQAPLQELVESLSSGPLLYRTGEERDTPNGIEHITVVKVCHKGDAEFLNALKDSLPRHAFLGKRIRGTLLT